jgi:cytochrome o ubiquinol oxidase subunit II
MSRKQKAMVLGLVSAVLLAVLAAYLHKHTVAVLQPRGQVASGERRVMLIAAGLGLLVVIPVYIMTFMIAWKYREGNKTKKDYRPGWDGHRGIEFIWWAIPSIIIFILAIVTWNSSHALDPYAPLASSAKPLQVQVVALDWKWLFVYPQQNIASVNLVKFPVNTPVDFIITSDAPMNSFWIPQLGGQIYAMPGMATELHLMAGKAGNYTGSSANISGNGFAGMDFTANASTTAEFDRWVDSAKSSPDKLSFTEYDKLAKPSKDNQVAVYSSAASGLFDYTVNKYNYPADFLKPGQPVPNLQSAGHNL